MIDSCNRALERAEDMAQTVPGQVVIGMRRHPLFHGAEPQRYAHLVPHIALRGRLQTYILGPGNRQLVLGLIEAGGFDGILPAAGHRGHFTEVVEDVGLASMELRILERMTWAGLSHRGSTCSA